MFLGRQSILVCFAWISTQVALWIAAVHGMMFDQAVWLFDVVFVVGLMTSGNFYLSSYGIVVLLPASTHFGFVLWLVHGYLHFKRKHR